MSTKNLKDGVLKAMILRAVLDGKHSSRVIFANIEYQNYNAFLVTMNTMVRYGYLSKIGKGKCNSKPFKYNLTKKGREHAHNPFLNLQHRKNYINKKAVEFMENTEQFQQAVAEYARAYFAGIGGAGGAGIVPPYDDMMGNSVEEEPKPHGVTTLFKPKELSEWQIKADARYERRLPILDKYKGEYLDERFFKLWKGIYPYLMKGKTFYGGMPGSVEIFSISNPEVTIRKHTKGRLTEEQIYLSKFHITKIHKKDGKIVIVEVMARGMKRPYLMKL